MVDNQPDLGLDIRHSEDQMKDFCAIKIIMERQVLAVIGEDEEDDVED